MRCNWKERGSYSQTALQSPNKQCERNQNRRNKERAPSRKGERPPQSVRLNQSDSISQTQSVRPERSDSVRVLSRDLGAVTGPLRVEGAFLVDALVGVRTKEVALALDQCGWEAVGADAVVVG